MDIQPTDSNAAGGKTLDPIKLFEEQFEAACAVDRKILPDPTAMTLATVGRDSQPSARVVLLKQVDSHGFVFYTNFESRKGRELSENPRVALCFHWPTLEVQIRVEGVAQPVSDGEADAYFATRPRDSQLGAWVSTQSMPLPADVNLETRLREMELRFSGKPVPRPPYWSGFRVVPECIEFWKNRPFRLHHRQLFTREGDGWRVGLLYP